MPRAMARLTPQPGRTRAVVGGVVHEHPVDAVAVLVEEPGLLHSARAQVQRHARARVERALVQRIRRRAVQVPARDNQLLLMDQEPCREPLATHHVSLTLCRQRFNLSRAGGDIAEGPLGYKP